MTPNRLRFMAWDKVKCKFVPGPFALIGETTMFDLLNQYSIDALNDLVMMQSTGLCDIKGVEIFDGYIVRIDHEKDWTPGVSYVAAVGWDDQWWHWGLFWAGKALDPRGPEARKDALNKEYAKVIEVIGNVHEDQRMLTEAANQAESGALSMEGS